jgi:hypothetical protein
LTDGNKSCLIERRSFVYHFMATVRRDDTRVGKYHPDDPIGRIGALESRAVQQQLSVAAQQRRLENRVEQMRPADLTRAQEKDLEPETDDKLEIPFETPEAAEAAEGEGALEGEAAVEGEAPLLEEAPPQPTMQEEMEELRRSFEPSVQGAPTSVLNNATGLVTPGSVAVDGVSAFDRATPGDTFCGGSRGMGGLGWMGAAMFGLTALSAFSPFMFGMPFMNPMGMGMGMGMMGGMGMMTPMLSMMSLNMMMGMNAMTPPMMGCMPYAMGSLPYAMPFMNPYCPPGMGMGMPPMGMPPMGMPPMGMPPMGMPPMGMPPMGMPQSPGAPPFSPSGVVSSVGSDGPPQSYLLPGAVAELTDAQKARLAALPPERQQTFQALWDGFKGVDLTMPGRSDKVRVNEALGQLLDTGKLDIRDKNGTDLLTNLYAMASQPMAAGLDNHLLTAQAIAHTADPAHTMTQGNRGTCAAATVEYMLARKNPSEYVRVATGLSSPQGVVDLASGKPVARAADCIPEDNSGRTALNRVVQAAFMNSEGLTAGSGQYSNIADRFQNVHSTGWNPFSRFKPKVEGLVPKQVQDLAGNALGNRYVEVFHEGQDPYQALPMIDRATRAPGNDGVPVSMQWDDARHRILVTGVENGRVYFRNPWGQRNSGNANDRLYGVDHQIGQDGLESIPIGDFAARMKSAIVPSELAV